ncbi:bifunctional methylenetetrahydrofolate dehydrogenase/methenyltetrahydrofolate cyclohydrolase FolD [Marinigracilibium pacificum]|uniref:Bifunctional protein FolD n=1 Tax=Marinigracilibium pacificum TaxID=2729599 RepID=A0A848J8G1_9BACT|nr:bifunctional methylenetetrahydrofolate dehydrogenase/methenyltetrahydrofolate cyclohydrolase FolD [Marinigracilibium pacificum]NMM49352.1 bifunctional methylenetetrahydrofolate dehydrogenase/methenyltetrahydrofolate cyclohydrolase FolD [Marinigracilibium pacificum]
MSKIIDGKATALQIQDEIKYEVERRKKAGLNVPHLAAVLVGDDGASLTYVNAKVKACERVGFDSTLIKLPASTSESDLLDKVNDLNNDSSIDGFIVQVPLPDHINEEKVIEAISPYKDVDGFHAMNMGKMLLGLPGLIPATPKGIMMLLEKNNIETEGKHAVVLGRSHTVGTPISVLLSRNTKPGNSTVTLVHSRTKNLKEISAQADILIVAIGKPEFVTADMVKEGAVVVDVGIHRIDAPEKKSGFKLKGDVAFAEVSEKASAITPVPGGVGPMTITALLHNTLLAADKK